MTTNKFFKLSFFLFCALFVFVQVQGQTTSELPRFAVISDTHFENNMGQGARVKVPQALKNLVAKGNIDAIFVVGDITDGGTTGQYDQLLAVFNDKSIVSEGIAVYYLMGNHDNFDGNGKTNYRNKLGSASNPYPFHQYIEIKGYPFITISQTGTGEGDYNAEAQTFLKNSLADAAIKYPGKPIFVFTHVPPIGTCYGSHPTNGWGSSIFPPILNQYPQVVTFSGHSHCPLGDPRSIFQDKFTAINDGSSTYSCLEFNEISGTTYDPDEKEFRNITEGVIVNMLENENVEIERWDTYRDEEILPKWLLEAPFDGTKFAYKDRNGLPAPEFGRCSEPDIRCGKPEITKEEDEDGYVLTFPQATDNDLVHRYQVDILENGNSFFSNKIFSQFYLNSQMPVKLSVSFQCPAAKTIVAQVKAIDSYSNVSSPVFSDEFVTTGSIPDPNTPLPEAKLLNVVFSENNTAKDISPLQNNITKGASTPITYLNTVYQKWAAKFSGSSAYFYKVDYKNNQTIKNAFSNEYSMEVMYMTNSTNNSCPFSATETGGTGIEQADSRIKFWIRLGSAYTTVSSLATITPGKYYHIVCTYSKAKGKVYIYVNGERSASLNVSGDFAFPSDTNTHWICIGGDVYGASGASDPLNGEIMTARIYDKAITRDEAYVLYQKEIENLTAINNPEISTGRIYTENKTLHIEGFPATTSLDIYNLLGQKLIAYPIIKGDKQINSLQEGIYVVKIGDKGIPITHKVIIK
jgi:predicted phosphodiesterase